MPSRLVASMHTAPQASKAAKSVQLSQPRRGTGKLPADQRDVRADHAEQVGKQYRRLVEERPARRTTLVVNRSRPRRATRWIVA